MRLPASVAAAGNPKTTSPLPAEIIRRLRGEGERFVAIAPGRLDVMGGLAEYTGGLILSLPLSEHACVGVQRRSDGVVSITLVDSSGRNGSGGLEIPVQQLHVGSSTWIDAKHGRSLAGAEHGNVVTCVLGTLVEAMRADLFPSLLGGVSIVMGTTVGGTSSGIGLHAATASAALVACAGACDGGIEPLRAAAICETVENHWLGFPSGPSDAVSALLGEPHSILQFRGDTRTSGGSLPIPDDIRLIGIDCGATHDEVADKYAQVRTASFMGRHLVDRIVRHDGLLNGHWDGFLSRVSVTDFVRHFRDRLPTRLTGRDFLSRFGESGDPLTRIDPGFVYKIRSRTEHHIYEHHRSRQFMEAFSRAIRTGDRSALQDAGEAMYASHWSCGQRCGLGSIEADALVGLLRKHGGNAGVHGARVTAHGGGGIVAVLADAGLRTEGAVEDALQAYQRKFGCQTRILNGSLPGALVTGLIRA